MYQIPAFDEESSLILAENTIETYKYEPVDVLIRCLERPPSTGEKNWRLTPDTISQWMTIELEREAQYRERVNNLYKTKDAEEIHQPIPDHVNQLIEDYKKSLKDGMKTIPLMTDKEIKAEGQHRPKKPEYHAPAVDYVTEWENRMRQYQYQTIKDRHPELSEEQIQQKLNQLPR